MNIIICELYFNFQKGDQEWGDSISEGLSQVEDRGARGTTGSNMSHVAKYVGGGAFLELLSKATATQLTLSSIRFLFSSDYSDEIP